MLLELDELDEFELGKPAVVDGMAGRAGIHYEADIGEVVGNG